MDTQILDGSAPSDDSKDGITLKLPPVRDDLVAKQVNTLLAMNNSTVANLAMLSNIDFESKGEYQRKEGGAREALEQTVLAVQSRLQSILNNEACWNLAERQTLEQHSVEVFELKKKSLRLSMAPHVRFKPNFQYLAGVEKWAVWIGDLGNEEQRILGTGDTIAEAIEAYDREFSTERAKRRRAQPTSGQTQQHEQNETRMDGTGNATASPDAAGQGPEDGDGSAPRRNTRGGRR